MGDDHASGTPTSPLKTLEEALDRIAAGDARRAVYLCADAGEYPFGARLDPPLALTPENAGGVAIYGSMSCSGESGVWTYDDTLRARLVSAAPVGVRIEGFDTESGGLELNGLVVETVDATHPGESSIPILAVDSPAVRLENVVLEAGRGGDGGTTAADWSDGAPAGLEGSAGHDACSGDPAGGAAVDVTCPDGETSRGGQGGDGASASDEEAEPGESGEPLMVENWGREDAGGELRCRDGETGEDGESGEPGAPVFGVGWLGRAGYVTRDGNPGAHGHAGQGGGGGGGALASSSCTSGEGLSGASGGGGGTGGCGGTGGKGGVGGGASIALALVDSPMTLLNVTLRALSGGAGGWGGHGQAGGDCGRGGGGGGRSAFSDARSACRGGMGGSGGYGGWGSGGAGGPSLGLAYVGAAPSITGVRASVADTPAPGGFHDYGGVAMPELVGGEGITAPELELGRAE